jgi:2-C-methyl-D-erythritol 2,4-cyclodiphosphate synthase
VFKIGFGYDIHRLVSGRRLVLGGVHIPSKKGLSGHSDADVILHAVADALLGAMGEDDIGAHFSNTDKKFKNISSLVILKKVAERLRKTQYSVGNIDAMLLLESPRIGPYKIKMRRLIAGALGVGESRVAVKATTNESMGAVGRGEAAAAYAVALINKRKIKKVKRKISV